ncbi:hypothetical protein GCM10009547_33640 [Sporichthya brevicatena]|uniref:DUF4190 domain-containing protein n=1 Tax=Sporichthya brevicatena TaxID=171442 RepID=A0ABN1H2N8_9ACTN
MTATAPSREHGRAQSPYARPEAPDREKKPREFRLDRTAAWLGGIALGCAVVPMLRWATIAFGTAALLMGITSLGRPKRAGARRDVAGIAIALAVLSGFGMVASQTAFSAVGGEKKKPVVNTAPPEVVQALTTEQVLSRQAKVEIGKVTSELDPSGIKESSLAVSITNVSGKTLSFDFEFVALDAKGKEITRDNAFVPTLGDGKIAAIKVFNILGNEMAEKLSGATFKIVKASAY